MKDEEPKNVLVIGGDDELQERMNALLPSPGFERTFISNATEGLNLTGDRSFDLVLIEFPLPGGKLEEFLKTVRWSGSQSRRSAMAILTVPEKLEEAEELLTRGISRILNLQATDERLKAAFDDIMAPIPRYVAHALVRIRGEALGLPRTLMAQTENLSATGMLVRFDKAVPIGARLPFAMDLPGSGTTISGTAAVVRYAGPPLDRVEGFAARFVDLEGDGWRRLEEFLRRMAEEARRSKGPPKPG